MAGRERSGLTEPMFYILMAFLFGEKCGIEVMDFIYNCSDGRVTVWPGTLYTILGKFEGQGLIRETAVKGRKRTYAITDKGRVVYEDELLRLRSCLDDARQAAGQVTADVELDFDERDA